MKNMFRSIMVLLLVAVMVVSVCLLASCGGQKDGEKDPAQSGQSQDQNQPAKDYNISVAGASDYGELTAKNKGAKDGGTLYEFTVTPREGYMVKTFNIGGQDVALKDNKLECVLKTDVTVSVTYQRKTNEELEARRDKVIEMIEKITGTQYKYDRDYKYYIQKNLVDLKAGQAYQGMPYANNPTVNYYAFMSDFVTGQDPDGTYIVGDILANDDPKNPRVWGNNCADVVYWSWAAVATSFKATWTQTLNPNHGIEIVGNVEIREEDYNSKGNYLETNDICENNGLEKMCEAYAMMVRGDGMVFYHPAGGHAIMVSEVKVVRGNDGKINADRSKLVYYDQNSGYSQKKGINGNTVTSSCAFKGEMKFSQLFADGYIPITCKELLDEKYAVEKEWVKDSIDKSKLTPMNVTRGYIESNYYLSKAQMVITDANGNVVFDSVRYRDEAYPKRILLSYFTKDTTDSYTDMKIYDEVLDMNALASGTYHCKLTAWSANNTEYVVRDFDFTK